MNVAEFQATWRAATLTERAAAQSHFNDLCRLLGHPTPTEADPAGRFFTFEKGLGKTGGGAGFADVWYRRHFGWEYKKPGEDLAKAYRQLKLYAEALENPPLLIVSDLQRIEIHTNFTNTATTTHVITLDDLDQPDQFRLLRQAFYEPDALKPGTTPETVTEEAAARFGKLAAALHARHVDPHRAAHFLVQLLFCLFAEDVGLLRRGLFTDLLALGARRPDAFPPQMTALLAAMRDGGPFGVEWVDRFNGGLFAEVGVETLTAGELSDLHVAAGLDWGAVEPAIFGTLFERSLDPAKRGQLGAHYTGKPDIERVVEPVVMTPLRRRWDQVRAEADAIKTAWDAATTPRTRDNRRNEFRAKLESFKHELASVRILDPACGSGNFLYVALAKLLDLEKEVIVYGAANGLPLGFPLVSPAQLFGLEINEYARELAQVVVWIGYLQWKLANGFPGNDDPILKPLETIRLQDALLDRSEPGKPKEAEWPAADFIIGNPPFVGDKKMRGDLGSDYVEDLRDVYRVPLPPSADLVCYFFEKARCGLVDGRAKRIGLLATNSIRGGANRRVLDRIKQSGDIFLAWSDQPWVLDGAAVRISIVGFDSGHERERCLDGLPVPTINADLTSSADITKAARLIENAGIGFLGVQKNGPFDIEAAVAHQMLALPLNPNGRPNSDVVKPRLNGSDVMRRARDLWLIDFGYGMPEDVASLYEAPFEYVRRVVKPVRDKNPEKSNRERWWIHTKPRPALRAAITDLDRFIVTPTVAKHRVFVWVDRSVVPDHQLVVFARDDDYFFGVLHSRAHEVWSLRMGTWLGVGNDPRYTPTTCFETFPLPWPPGQEPTADPRVQAIAAAAKDLDDKRRAWLDPPGATPADLKKRTLTNLYNARPAWLAQAHARLDQAVWAAYGWEDDDPSAVAEDAILSRLLALNEERSRTESPI
jgi:type II restriction/modification system DNA methylase subunit YeeA